MTIPRIRTATARPTNNQRDDGAGGTGASPSVSVWITSDELFSVVFMLCLHLRTSRSRLNRFVIGVRDWLCIRRSGPSVQKGKHRRDKEQSGYRGAEQTSNDSAA